MTKASKYTWRYYITYRVKVNGCRTKYVWPIGFKSYDSAKAHWENWVNYQLSINKPIWISVIKKSKQSMSIDAHNVLKTQPELNIRLKYDSEPNQTIGEALEILHRQQNEQGVR